MLDDKDIEMRIGLNAPSKTTSAQSKSLQDYLKQQYENRSTEEQLKEALFHLKVEMQCCVQASEQKDIKPVGYYIEKGMDLFKEIAKINRKQLAEIWGTTASNLRKYIKGERSLNPSLARRIAISFSIPFDLLLRIDVKNTAAQMTQLQVQEPAAQYTIHHILNQSA